MHAQAAGFSLFSNQAQIAVESLLAALHVCDDETHDHAYRVADLAVELTETVAPELAAEPGLRHAYLLHDIGKIAVSESILLKTEPLNEYERRILRSHTTLGGRIVSTLNVLPPVVWDVVTCHHEHWDGSGYPLGLQRHQIPLAARIFAVADAFDAMTHDRPYRRALPRAEALRELKRCAWAQFDPNVVERFLSRIVRPDDESPLTPLGPDSVPLFDAASSWKPLTGTASH